MAGSGRKSFVSGSLLSAVDVQNYLQDQVVMVFSNSTTRNTSLGTSVAEGMISFLKDSDQVQSYNGSVWLPQPYAQSAGSTALSSSSATISFPANRFTQIPVVTATVAGTSSKPELCVISSVGTASFVVEVYASQSASSPFNNFVSASGRTIHWQAVQMSGTASGG